jgi:hypothetical protein
MKKYFSRYRIALFALSILSSAAFADQSWSGTYVNSVLDEDLLIKGDVLLPLGGTRIEAVHRDVTVTLKKDAKVSASWAGESQLYLMAAEGRKIRFVLDHDLQFVGSSVSGDDLLVIQSGPGTVEMAVGAGNTFKITSQEGSGGVQMYVLMYGGESAQCDEYCPTDEYCCNVDEYLCDEYCALGNGLNETSASRPTLSFVTLPGLVRAPDANSKIVVGERSRLSFLSSRKLDIAADSGYITFDPSTDSLGRMVLKIKDTGAFTVAGHFTCQRNSGCITLSAIDRAIPAGYQAIWSIVNSRGANFASGLLVLNENATMFDLLADPFLNLDIRNQVYRSFSDSITNYSGDRLGVVVGANGELDVQSNSYLDFVGLALNQMPCIECVNGFDGVQASRLLKMRNPSALFVDGNHDVNATPALFSLAPQSAVFFRSGIANDGVIRYLGDVDPFTIDASEHTPGFGNIVFDVEGELNVQGQLVDGNPTSKIELLSLEVLPTGGSLFVGSSETNFPLRTFNTEDGELLAYNTGAFLINNTINLHETALSHTDVNHTVVADNDLLSEPAYIGGETFKFAETTRPSIRFFNADLLVNSDIALTGLDLVVPNVVDAEGILHKNNVGFVFYSNGACIDNGTGRQMILGTRIGSTAADGCSRISNDAHLDIMELFNAVGADYPITDTDNQTLHLLVDFNSAAITNVDPELGHSINTIHLGHSSNISIGMNADETGFNIDTNPWLRIQGNYFSFTSKDGLNGCPNDSNLTGKGGIFVDLNGKLSIDPGFIASFCTMITRSHNGIVDLPAGQVFFCNGVGIADWNTDLSIPADQIIVGPGQSLPTFVFNWNLVKKDCANFSPYQSDGCLCGPATEENVSSLPIIQGTIDNLIIQGSRFGDPATFIIDGGLVRNLDFAANDCCTVSCNPLSGQAPVAVIVLRNGGTVELSGEALGSNGVTIIADGSGIVDVNANTTIGAGCSLVKGPNFVTGTDVLTINSSVSSAITLSGTLDVSSFDAVGDLVQFTGNVSVVAEPGSRIITGLGTLSFADFSQLNFEAAFNAATFFDAIPHGAHNPLLNPLAVVDAASAHNQYASLTNFAAGLQNTDAFRVRLIGQGTIQLKDSAQANIPSNAFVGVETLNDDLCEISTTNLTVALNDNAQFNIGNLNDPEGGVFQIGNVRDMNMLRSRRNGAHSVNFSLIVDGLNAEFMIGSQGFMGLGVGIERFDGKNELGVVVPNENIVNTLFNVNSITFNFLSGRFEDSRIFSGADTNASLFAISGDESVSYNMTLGNLTADPFNFAGGANMALVYPGAGGLHPIVLDQDGQVEVAPGVFSPRLWVSVIASTLLQNNTLEQTGLNGLEFFDLLKTHDAVLETTRPNTIGRANISTDGQVVRPAVNGLLADTVSQGVIVRGPVFSIIGAGTEADKRQVADEAGAVFVNIDVDLNEILTATLIEA